MKIEDRVLSLEHRTQTIESQLAEVRHTMDANTRLTQEIHGKNAEMYDSYTHAKNAVIVIAKTGNGIMWVADKTTRLAKPLLILTILSGSVWTGLRVPEWATALLRLIQ